MVLLVRKSSSSINKSHFFLFEVVHRVKRKKRDDSVWNGGVSIPRHYRNFQQICLLPGYDRARTVKTNELFRMEVIIVIVDREMHSSKLIKKDATPRPRLQKFLKAYCYTNPLFYHLTETSSEFTSELGVHCAKIDTVKNMDMVVVGLISCNPF